MNKFIPLPEKLRPKALEQVVGQDHLLADGGLLNKIILSKKPSSLLFWGPPGCGKTTLAKLYAEAFSAHFISLSAVTSGLSDLKQIVSECENQPLFHTKTILFIDEIHRFNKGQQDALLPHVEKGTFILVGATTENPSFALNGALLSRLQVLPLKSLSFDALEKIYQRFQELSPIFSLETQAKEYLKELAQGDGRAFLNKLESLEKAYEGVPIEFSQLEKLFQKKSAYFDKKGDWHYNLISALHKSVRGSDPDAALYWFARMLEGGEPPLYLARRLIRMAIEDIGLADPSALNLALHGWETYEKLGSPEGDLALAQVVIYLALAPKSNKCYEAFLKAKELAAKTSHLQPPQAIINAPTSWMKKEGFGNNYQYDPETLHGFSGQNYFPQEMGRADLYHPVQKGFEREMKKRIEYFKELRERLQKNSKDN